MGFLSFLKPKAGGSLFGNITRAIGINPTPVPPYTNIQTSPVTPMATSPVAPPVTSPVQPQTFLQGLATGVLDLFGSAKKAVDNGIQTNVSVDTKPFMILGAAAVAVWYFFIRKK